MPSALYGTPFPGYALTLDYPFFLVNSWSDLRSRGSRCGSVPRIKLDQNLV